jgi:hypothetical protein
LSSVREVRHGVIRVIQLKHLRLDLQVARQSHIIAREQTS